MLGAPKPCFFQLGIGRPRPLPRAGDLLGSLSPATGPSAMAGMAGVSALPAVIHAGIVVSRPRPAGPRAGDGDRGFCAGAFGVAPSVTSAETGGVHFTSIMLAPVLPEPSVSVQGVSTTFFFFNFVFGPFLRSPPGPSPLRPRPRPAPRPSSRGWCTSSSSPPPLRTPFFNFAPNCFNLDLKFSDRKATERPLRPSRTAPAAPIRRVVGGSRSSPLQTSTNSKPRGSSLFARDSRWCRVKYGTPYSSADCNCWRSSESDGNASTNERKS
mmetsp:Transcript_14087/g.38554  ORF Transcript_14087/g.38554 Transcript_14087/m.38554 type:complete len:269 (+) Transcript_14087:1460-2266(+)